ncbi:MAG: fumarate hydratase [bacterium]
MRTIECARITDAVAGLCAEANFILPGDVEEALSSCFKKEPSPIGREVIGALLENARIAGEESLPICQDCGLAVVFLEVGQEVRLTGGDLERAVQEGVRKAYVGRYLRKSVVDDPLFERKNTKDNTPAVIHTEIVPGDHLKITILPKGGGSENMSALGLLAPSLGARGVVEFVVQAVERAGSNPCPPVIVGVGIGGTAEKAMLLAKRAILRKVGLKSLNPAIAELENEILERVNALGIGPQGFGGRMTALAVHIEEFPCHIASLPVAVNLQCHAARHKEAIL